MVGTEVQLSGIESHNSIGSGESYYAPLRRIYRKIRNDQPKLNVVIQLSVKAINDAMGLEELFPSLLVFGCIPILPSVSSAVPGQKERMNALQLLRQEMEVSHLNCALPKLYVQRQPWNSGLIIRSGDKVRVFRETDKKYAGHFPVIRVDEKQVFVIDDNKEKQFSLH